MERKSLKKTYLQIFHIHKIPILIKALQTEGIWAQLLIVGVQYFVLKYHVVPLSFDEMCGHTNFIRSAAPTKVI